MRRWIGIVLLALLALFMILIAVNSRKTFKIAAESPINISDGWTINNRGVVSENQNCTYSDIGVINEKEIVLISKTLDDFGINNPCLTFYSIHSIVYVYLDHKLIYSYGKDFYDAKSVVPKRHHHISLGSNYQGKLLTISFTGSGPAAFSGLSSVFVGNRFDMLVQDIYQVKISFFSGFFMFTLGVILIILSPYLFLFHDNDTRIFFSGLISLLLGVYVMSFYGIIDLLVNNALLNTFLEYATLYNIPTAILGYLMSTFTGNEKKWFKFMFLFDVALFLLSVILHYSHLAIIYEFTPILHVVAGVQFVITAVILRNYYKNKKKDSLPGASDSENFFLVGLVIFMSLAIVDIIRYNYQKYSHGAGEPSASLTGLTYGALAFVFCLLVSYLFYNIFSKNADSMQSQIINLAYTDPLTGLSNRARCEQMINALSEEHGTYTIISLDLNKLKFVNDTLGHHEGDRLITGFSTILTECFWDANLIGRMGGDEFIVILMEDRALGVTKRIHELYALISEWNRKEQNFQYSTSYGYAYSYEVPSGSAKEVYMLADNRMYEMKREHQGLYNEEVMEDYDA